MIDVNLHYRGIGSDRRRLPAIPSTGSYIIGPGAERRLWQVSAVVLDGKGVDVFAAEVSVTLTSELTSAWATWGEAMAAAE